MNCELCWQLFVPNRSWKYNTDVECDIGSVLHKEGSPPCNVNTEAAPRAPHRCHVWPLPPYQILPTQQPRPQYSI